eukprot:1068940-Prymnesium_polylepis.1
MAGPSYGRSLTWQAALTSDAAWTSKSLIWQVPGWVWLHHTHAPHARAHMRACTAPAERRVGERDHVRAAQHQGRAGIAGRCHAGH